MPGQNQVILLRLMDSMRPILLTIKRKYRLPQRNLSFQVIDDIALLGYRRLRKVNI